MVNPAGSTPSGLFFSNEPSPIVAADYSPNLHTINPEEISSGPGIAQRHGSREDGFTQFPLPQSYSAALTEGTLVLVFKEEEKEHTESTGTLDKAQIVFDCEGRPILLSFQGVQLPFRLIWQETLDA